MTSKTSKGVKCLDDNFVMPSDVKRAGYMKKLKTMKRKYFVLRDNNDSNEANLCYYDSEKKFRNSSANSQPKRVIYLKDCFSINRKIDGKHKYAIALYTKEDCFTTIVDEEDNLKQWLEALVDSQLLCNDFRTGHCIQYEHVWQVNINRNGLGQTRNMNGVHRLCLTANTLYIVKVDAQSDPPDVYEFPLISIRRCGHTTSTFFIELGRSSSIGPGDIWIQAEDSAIAQNMHEVILAAMSSSKNHEDFGPSQRPRSASTSDKPISSRRPTQTSHTNQNVASFGTSYSSTATTTTAKSTSTNKNSIRERCDSMPSRSRTTSESDSTHDSRHWTPVHYQTTDRLHSGVSARTFSYSPPSHNPLSASSAACSTDSAGSSLSISEDFDISHCLTPVSEHHSGLHNSLIPSEPPISEEDVQTDDYLSMSPTGSSTGRPSSGFRSHLNLNFCPTNTSPITSPTMGSNKSVNQSIREDMSPYMPMSPVGSVETESLASSRRSSGLEKQLNTETSSEYMPMMSSQEIKSNPSEEYLNMAPFSESLPKMNSSLHHMKEEFHLEKVKSYFSPSDQNDSFDYIPPVRAYSIGSRPQPQPKPFMKVSSLSKQLLTKSGTQTPEEEEIRMRAFSMGSHANTREMRVAARKQALIEAQIGGPTQPIEEVSRHSAKASSAPVLSPAAPRKRSATVGCRPVFNKSTLNADRSDTDLMEIDYSKSGSQSKPLKDRIEDRVKRSSAGHRQRSNSRSSTSSSGIGSTSTTSPSITSSMSELTDKKREMLSTHPIPKTGDEPTSRVSHSSAKDPNSEYLQHLITNLNQETKLPSSLPSSHRPNTGQVSQQTIPTVPPIASLHSSLCLPQSHCKTLPTNQTNITKSETFAQKADESERLSTKPMKKSNDENDCGDYVCLDMSSTTRVPQSTANSSQVLQDTITSPIGSIASQSVPNEQSFDRNNSFVDKNQIKTIPQNTQNMTNDITAKTVATKQLSAPKAGADGESERTSGLRNADKDTLNPKKWTENHLNITQNESTTTTTTSPVDKNTNTENLPLGSTSRRSSTSSEKELNYASLDLAPPLSAVPTGASVDSADDYAKASVKCGPQVSTSGTSMGPMLSCCGSQELLYCSVDSNQLSYAEIDFGIANKKIAKS